MTRDRSLDEFTGSDSDDDSDEATTADADSAGSDESATADTDSVEPVAPTFTAAPDDEACGECGAAVGVRWRAEDGEGYVCVDCKEW